MKKIITIFILSLFINGPFALAAVEGPTTIPVTPAAPKFTDAERQAELAQRRAAVAAKMVDKSVLILLSTEPKLYTNDVDYVYRQENNLYYLTNLKQKDATLVITKDGSSVREFLFIPQPDPRNETWNGKMYTYADVTRISGITKVTDAVEKDKFLQSIRDKKNFASINNVAEIAAPVTVYLLLPEGDRDTDGLREFGVENELAKQLSSSYKVENAQPIFADLRQIKSPYELRMLQHAIDISTEAHMRSWAMAGRAKMEYEVQAEVEYTFRRRNADYWGYPSIVGCGPNATTLHYEESQGSITNGSLLLMDVGAEYEHYSADVTRTFPVNGKFTKEQSEIYQIVYNAQEAAAKAAKPGATMTDLSNAANAVIVDGLFKLGLITDKTSSQYRIWYMHGLGHWLGMNVHDVGRYEIPLRSGMTYTNEPGIYIREDALKYLPDTPEWNAFKAKIGPAFEKYKNIGVRIEDDMVITPTGAEWMTKNLPRKMEDIEAFMAVGPKQFFHDAAEIMPASVSLVETLALLPKSEPFEVQLLHR
ncbi:MAG: aminopeptidase P family protein [Acidobacteriota bacterium]